MIHPERIRCIIILKNVSYNKLSIISTFYPTTSGTTVISFQDSHPRNYYMPYDSIANPIGYTTDGDFREHTLLKDAVNAIASQIPTNLNIDSDNDGKVDNVVFIMKEQHLHGVLCSGLTNIISTIIL